MTRPWDVMGRVSASFWGLSLLTALAAQTKPKVCDALVPGTPLSRVNKAAPAVLDLGSTRTVQIEIFGHSENRGYDPFLQQMLDASPPLPGVKFLVRNNWIGGHEAYRWATSGQRGYQTIEARLQARLYPMICLCLFSNNATRPILKPDTTDANFRLFVQNLLDIADHVYNQGKGASMVYFSAHRYKPSNLLPAWYETAATLYMIGEAERQKKAYIKAGPEQHDLHWCCFPACYASDRAHTNRQGDILMATAWYNLLVRELTGCFSQPFGDGSSGSGGHVPVLGPRSGFPRLGNTSFTLATSAALGGAPLAYLLGTRKLAGPVLVLPEILLYGVAAGTGPGAGAHALPLPIPPDPALHGLRLETQTAALDSGAGIGLSFTQGLTLALCR